MLKKLFFAVSLLCAGCSPMGASGPTLEQRLDEQDREIRQMRPQQADTWNEVQAMREEIRQLKGQLNALNSGGAGALATRQPDDALSQAGNNTALNMDPGPTMPAQASSPVQAGGEPAPTAKIVTPESSAYVTNVPAGTTVLPPPVTTAQPRAADSYGLPPDPVQASQPAHPEVPSESTWGQADPKPVVLQTPKKDISLALFDAGINDYNARKYAEAERSFKDFVKNYPNHSQIAEAQYYIGECEFQRNNFPVAALEYDKVITQYPKSSNAPGAYLKQAIAFSKMKNSDAAKQRMRQLISKFPNSPEAARAKTFLKTNK